MKFYPLQKRGLHNGGYIMGRGGASEVLPLTKKGEGGRKMFGPVIL